MLGDTVGDTDGTVVVGEGVGDEVVGDTVVVVGDAVVGDGVGLSVGNSVGDVVVGDVVGDCVPVQSKHLTVGQTLPPLNAYTNASV